MDFTKQLLAPHKEDAFEPMEEEDNGRSRRGRGTASAYTRSSQKQPEMESLTRELDSLKLIANVAQKNRLHASVLLWTLKVPIEIVQPSIKAAKEFGVENKGKQHSKGSPHIHVYRHFLHTIIKEIEKGISDQVSATSQPNQEMAQALFVVKEHYQNFISSGPKKGYYHVRQARARATRNEKIGIFTFELSMLLPDPRSVQLAIIYMIEKLDGEILEGTEAATDLERKCQGHIESLKQMIGQ
jgi:hypothetical protein